MQPPYAHVLDVQRLIELHALGLSLASTVGPQPDVDCLQGGLGNAWSAEEYRAEEIHVSPGLLFGCYLLTYLLKDHCAADGNKRMAWLALIEVLAHYELTVEAEDVEVEELCNRVITDDLGGEEVAEWLLERLAALPTASLNA